MHPRVAQTHTSGPHPEHPPAPVTGGGLTHGRDSTMKIRKQAKTGREERSRTKKTLRALDNTRKVAEAAT